MADSINNTFLTLQYLQRLQSTVLKSGDEDFRVEHIGLNSPVNTTHFTLELLEIYINYILYIFSG